MTRADCHQPLKGRGISENPVGRFEPLQAEADWDWSDLTEADHPSPGTTYLRDASPSIVSYNGSPDSGFNASVNPCRACEHGWINYRV